MHYSSTYAVHKGKYITIEYMDGYSLADMFYLDRIYSEDSFESKVNIYYKYNDNDPLKFNVNDKCCIDHLKY